MGTGDCRTGNEAKNHCSTEHGKKNADKFLDVVKVVEVAVNHGIRSLQTQEFPLRPRGNSPIKRMDGLFGAGVEYLRGDEFGKALWNSFRYIFFLCLHNRDNRSLYLYRQWRETEQKIAKANESLLTVYIEFCAGEKVGAVLRLLIDLCKNWRDEVFAPCLL